MPEGLSCVLLSKVVKGRTLIFLKYMYLKLRDRGWLRVAFHFRVPFLQGNLDN